MIYCHDINGAFKGLIHEQNPSEWRGFIHYSQQSLKAVPLHNENSNPSTLIAHSVHLKQTHDEMKILLQAIQYNVQEWGICGDLKMTGMQGDARRLYEDLLFLILWDSRSTAEYYMKREWELSS